jgi:hypothetical protein
VTNDDLLALAARGPERPAAEIRVNFGMFAGREATVAELDDLAQTLLRLVDDVSVVAERRREVGPDAEAAIHQVRVEVAEDALPDDDAAIERLIGRLQQETERWAEACIADRRLEVGS